MPDSVVEFARGLNFESQLCHIIYMKIDHVIIYIVIFPLPLIQEGQLSTGDQEVAGSILAGWQHSFVVI